MRYSKYGLQRQLTIYNASIDANAPDQSLTFSVYRPLVVTMLQGCECNTIGVVAKGESF